MANEKKKRIERYSFIEDAKRTLFGDALVKWLISKKLGIRYRDIIFHYNEHGKPFLRGYPFFNFNISHSGDWVVCAISCKNVGIDIEQVMDIDLGIARRFFSEQEYKDIIGKPKHNQLSYFYDLWTLKESYIKYKGKGLSFLLDTFTINKENEDISLYKNNKKIHLNFNQCDIGMDYKMSVCAIENKFSEAPVIVNIEGIITQMYH